MVRTRLALAMLALLISCTSGEDPGPAVRPPAGSGGNPLITSLPTSCRGIGRAPRRGEITFISGGRLIASTPNSREVRCLAKVAGGDRIDWGGEGDRAVVSLSGSEPRVIFPSSDYVLSTGETDARAFGLSRPRGTSVLYGSADSRRLYKIPSNGGRVEDISFLERHDEAIYHPAGEHIFVVGEDRRGRYGIFLATNLGTDPQLLVIGEDARRIYSLTFSLSGVLYYAAEHDDRHDVHGLSLSPTGTGKVDTSGLKTFYSSPDPIARVVVSQFYESGRFAVEVEGNSSEGCPSETLVWVNRSKTISVPDRPSRPVGWLPNGSLLYVALGTACDAAELYTWGGKRSLLVADDVQAAAVRGRFPPPPNPPTRLPEVVA